MNTNLMLSFFPCNYIVYIKFNTTFLKNVVAYNFIS